MLPSKVILARNCKIKNCKNKIYWNLCEINLFNVKVRNLNSVCVKNYSKLKCSEFSINKLFVNRKPIT